eukprot:2848735-Rhodomonas_salina.3
MAATAPKSKPNTHSAAIKAQNPYAIIAETILGVRVPGLTNVYTYCNLLGVCVPDARAAVAAAGSGRAWR